eukprot:10459385-Heterocapsa_arctica.AAC.1
MAIERGRAAWPSPTPMSPSAPVAERRATGPRIAEAARAKARVARPSKVVAAVVRKGKARAR